MVLVIYGSTYHGSGDTVLTPACVIVPGVHHLATPSLSSGLTLSLKGLHCRVGDNLSRVAFRSVRGVPTTTR